MNSSQIKTIQAATPIGSNVTEPNQTQTVTVNIGKDIQEVEKHPEIVEERQCEPISVAEKNDSTTDLARRYNEIITCKDKYIQALHIILNIIRNNPLIIKHFVIANGDDLSNLVRLLTNADEVEITLNYDADCGCCGDSRVALVDKIYVRKQNDLYIFKQSFPEAVKILDDHKISCKMVLIRWSSVAAGTVSLEIEPKTEQENAGVDEIVDDHI